MNLGQIRAELQALADPAIAAHSARFFRTGPGEYGEGDRFLGIRVPRVRALAKRCGDLSLARVAGLLRSRWHEERLLAVIILAGKFDRASADERGRIAEFYLAHTDRVNNWDLVDTSAHRIVGPWLQDRPRGLLRDLARSDSLWERRIAVMATYHFIRQGDFGDTLDLCALLLDDDQDLIHKVCGWMLREVAKRDRTVAEAFLRQHHARLPRTMLRYAIEKFPEPLRRSYLSGTWD
ncbi:DNA alkylation repair protein [bacterium]|nr:DNA alkylation repair protein [bacterium]